MAALIAGAPRIVSVTIEGDADTDGRVRFAPRTRKPATTQEATQRILQELAGRWAETRCRQFDFPQLHMGNWDNPGGAVNDYIRAANYACDNGLADESMFDHQPLTVGGTLIHHGRFWLRHDASAQRFVEKHWCDVEWFADRLARLRTLSGFRLKIAVCKWRAWRFWRQIQGSAPS